MSLGHMSSITRALISAPQVLPWHAMSMEDWFLGVEGGHDAGSSALAF